MYDYRLHLFHNIDSINEELYSYSKSESSYSSSVNGEKPKKTKITTVALKHPLLKKRIKLTKIQTNDK